MSNFAIARVQKLSASSIGSAERHNERLNLNYKNADIRADLKSENVCFLACDNYKKLIDERVAVLAQNENKTKTGKLRKLRADAPRALEYVITASAEHLATMSKDDQIAFFRDAFEMLKKKHGERNAVAAVVHYDEVRDGGSIEPHLHAIFVPENSKGQLRAKDFMSLKSLSKLQDEVAEVGARYGMSRGRRVSDLRVLGLETPKHQSQYAWKAEQQAQVTADAQAVKNAELQIHLPKRKLLESAENYQARVNEANRDLLTKAEKGAILSNKITHLVKENAHLKEVNTKTLSALGAVVKHAQVQSALVAERNQEIAEQRTVLRLVKDACEKSAALAASIGEAVRAGLSRVTTFKRPYAIELKRLACESQKIAETQLNDIEKIEPALDDILRQRFGDKLPPELAARLAQSPAVDEINPEALKHRGRRF